MLLQRREALRRQRLGGGATGSWRRQEALGPPEGAQPRILEPRLTSRTLASRQPGAGVLTCSSSREVTLLDLTRPPGHPGDGTYYFRCTVSGCLEPRLSLAEQDSGLNPILMTVPPFPGGNRGTK